MENNNQNNKCESCEKSPCCRCCSNHGSYSLEKNHIIKKIALLVTLLLTFCLGYQFGEIKGMLKQNRNLTTRDTYTPDNADELNSIWNKMSEENNTQATIEIPVSTQPAKK